MADTLVHRTTGRDPLTDPVPVRVDLVMTDRSLLDGADGAASMHAPGQAPVVVPAPLARHLVAAAAAHDAAWVRRLFLAPESGALVAAESRSRRFPTGLADLITLRDQTCATPWCDAPIRHLDHITPHAHDGPTSLVNGQGLCEHCNLAKQTPGWQTTGTGGNTTVTTPTGHTYTGTAPPVLGYPPSSETDQDETRHREEVDRAIQHALEQHAVDQHAVA